MSGTFTQMFPPAPSFTEARLKDLSGKVFIVTGGNSGVGFELAKILYQKNGSVYIASRSPDKIKTAIRQIQGQSPKSRGTLSALKLDLADMKSIKASAEDFLAKSDRLDVIFHNAGVMTPPANSKSPSGHDLEMATNCLGPFLLNRFLEPILRRTAASSEPGSVRVVWLASLVNVGTAAGGIVFNEATGAPNVLKNAMENYMQTKVGNVFLAHESARALGDDGIISLSVNPGLMKTELQRHGPAAQGVIMKVLFKGPRYGAYSELYAGVSPDIKGKDNGGFIIPWGRFGALPNDISRGLQSKSEGGTGAAGKFWDWAEKQTQAYR